MRTFVLWVSRYTHGDLRFGAIHVCSDVERSTVAAGLTPDPWWEKVALKQLVKRDPGSVPVAARADYEDGVLVKWSWRKVFLVQVFVVSQTLLCLFSFLKDYLSGPAMTVGVGVFGEDVMYVGVVICMGRGQQCETLFSSLWTDDVSSLYTVDLW